MEEAQELRKNHDYLQTVSLQLNTTMHSLDASLQAAQEHARQADAEIFVKNGEIARLRDQLQTASNKSAASTQPSQVAGEE